MDTERLEHLLRPQDISLRTLLRILEKAGEIKQKLAKPEEKAALRRLLVGRTMIQLFEGESPRTQLYLGMAATNLGMDVLTSKSMQLSSAVTGGTVDELVRVLFGAYPDVLAIRHGDDDTAKRAAAISDQFYGGIPVFNAGCGKKYHPSQSIADILTVLQRTGRLNNLSIAIGADALYSRMARSFAYMLADFEGITIRFITPPELAPPEELVQHLREAGVCVILTENVIEGIEGADVVYWGRMYTNRAAVADFVAGTMLESRITEFQIGTEALAAMKDGAFLMHPSPISEANEIALAVRQGDFPQYAVYQQAQNVLPVDMALLLELLGDSGA